LGELGPDASAQDCAKSASVLSSSSAMKRSHFPDHKYMQTNNLHNVLFSAFKQTKIHNTEQTQANPKGKRVNPKGKLVKCFPSCWLSLGPLLYLDAEEDNSK